MQRFCRFFIVCLVCLPIVVLGFLGLCVVASSNAAAQTMVLPGKFDVSPVGAASFSIPISVPPGTAGMVPDLSLDYSSGGGEGPVGLGWSLGGLAAITRCPQTLAQDHNRGAITYDVGISAGQPDNDRFCLNGQRLIAISGNYGADGTQYRTELEGFSEIISHGYTGSSPTWFEVHTKSGQTMYFGNTTDSRMMLGSFASARSWLVNQISDTKGNYMSVSYYNPNYVAGNSEVLPSQIIYTGNSNTGLAPYNKVTFVYATRPDIIPAYTDGVLSETTQRLTDIKTWIGTPASPGVLEVNDYQIGYQTSSSTARSLLSSITMCDGNGSSGTCLPARTFGAQAGSANLFNMSAQSIPANFGNPPTAAWTLIEGDFNGDGRSDFVFFGGTSIWTLLSNGNGTFTTKSQTISGNFGNPATNYWTLIQGDFNGDGRSDFAFIDVGTVYTFLSNGDGTFTQVGQILPGNVGSPPHANFGSPPSATWTLIQGDFNGDGRSDFALLSVGTLYTMLSNGDGTFTQSQHTIPGNVGNPPAANFGIPPSANWALIEGDFNGDGKGDFALLSDSSIFTFLSNGDGSFTQGQQTISANFGNPPGAYWTLIQGDFNGDGLSDFALMAHNQLYSFLSTGAGFFTMKLQTIGADFGAPLTKYWSLVATGDFIGDGRTDFSLLDTGTLYNFYSAGDGTFTVLPETLPGSYGNPPTANYGSPPAATWTPVSGDFNGDGLGDFALVNQTTVYSFLASGPDPDLMTSINNGIGATTTVNYGTLALGWGSYYSGWSSPTCSAAPASYPTVDIAAPLPVVASTSSSNGIGGQYTSTYGYSCARVDTTGRGFLGFAQQTVTDSQTGIEQTTNFYQFFPFIGQVSTAMKTLGSLILNSTTNYYVLLTGSTSPALPWSGTNFVFNGRSVVASNDLDGTALPTVTTTSSYDSYGNAVQVATSKMLGSVQGSTQTTNNTYQAPNTTYPYWILGRLTQSQVVSTTP